MTKFAAVLLYKPYIQRKELSLALASFCSSKNIFIEDILTIDEASDYKEIRALIKKVSSEQKPITLVTNKKLQDSLSLPSSWLELLELSPELLTNEQIYDKNQTDPDLLKFYITEVRTEPSLANKFLSYLF